MWHHSSHGSFHPVARRRFQACIEALESRTMLSVVTVNAGDAIRTVNADVLGVNIAYWESSVNTTQTEQMVQAAGLDAFRFPGGSSSDTYHFNAAPTYNGEGTAASMAEFASENGVGMVTIDYGSGSPQEGAAFLAYLDGSPSDTTSLGEGEQWNGSAWVEINWQTVGYWASLRAAAPLTQDDGLNFLRADHPASFNINYVEVGNEVYGSWETDNHGSGGDTGKPHDPATYISFAKTFSTLAQEIDPGVMIGIDSGSVGSDYNNWISNVLEQCATQGFTPGFISDHVYMQNPGSESDSFLLFDTVSDTTQTSENPLDWAQRSADYEALLTKYLGAAGKNVQLLATEFNSVNSDPGKQTTSLVNGLFVADALGSILQTSYNGAWVWDLRNGWSTGNNDSSSLYGWREGGDYGLLGSPTNGVNPPSTGTYVPYPTYFAEQLVSEMVHNGDTVVSAASNDPDLDAYAVVEQSDGHLDLLVINKSSTSNLTEQFQIQGFTPSGTAEIWQYGEAQDTAQSESSTGASSLSNSTTTLTVSGDDFSYTFPMYSMTVIDLTPVPATVSKQYVFYYGSSAFDGSATAPSSADQNAIATDKSALLPGQTATFSNVSSYVDGINGILVEFSNLPAGVTFSASDFQFNVGNNGTPSGWAAAPAPTAVATWSSGGNTFADIVWTNGAIRDEWLQVTVLADGNTHLASNDVFYFGSLVGATGASVTSTSSGSTLQVTSADVEQTELHLSEQSTVPITSLYDFDRNGQVNSTDVEYAELNLTEQGGLELINLASSGGVVVPAESQGSNAQAAAAVLTTTNSSTAASSDSQPGVSSLLQQGDDLLGRSRKHRA